MPTKKNAGTSPEAGSILDAGDGVFQAAWPGLSDAERSAIGPAGFERWNRLNPHIGKSIERAERSGKSKALLSSGLLLSDKGVIKACEYNARQLMDALPQFKGLHFDEFLYRPRIDNRDWTDHDDRDTLCLLQATYHVPGFTLGQIRTAAMALAFARRRDSLFEFVMNNPKWDGEPRIALALVDAWGAADNALTRAASFNFFVSLHARAVAPGVQLDTLLVIEGPQGGDKSRSFRKLGGNFHAEISAAVGTLDFQRELRGLWIAELSELDSLRGRDAPTIKRLLSSPSDRFVEKFEKHAQVYPRRAVIVATTNETTYWQDSTGARRLIPIRAGEIRLDLIEDLRLQWFAEARSLYEGGATWWEFPAGTTAAQDDRQLIDPWEDVLASAIANGRSSGAVMVQWPTEWISSAEIMRTWLHLEPAQQGQASSSRLGKIMRRLGFVPQRYGKQRERGWIADTSEGNE